VLRNVPIGHSLGWSVPIYSSMNTCNDYDDNYDEIDDKDDDN
jgi:hypothetical protein